MYMSFISILLQYFAHSTIRNQKRNKKGGKNSYYYHCYYNILAPAYHAHIFTY